MGPVFEALAIFRRELAVQGERAIPWAVTAFAAGIILFFTWPFDPPLWAHAAAAGLCAALIGACPIIRARPVRAATIAVTIALTAAAAGHGAAQVRTAVVGTPLLAREIGPVMLTGRIVATERRPGVNRIVIAPEAIPGVAPAATPRRLRLNIPRTHGLPATGDTVTVRAVVGPALRPAVPDGFQFQRFLYFQRIGGIGYAVGRWQAETQAQAPPWRADIAAAIESWRRAIGARVEAVVPGAAGAVATALINGEQNVIPEDVQDAYRAAGLAHLLSISGFHMTLLAGVVFFLIRRMLALFPAVALRADTKKIAAWTALAVTFFYLLISGMSVPAVRAFMMIAVVLAAVLLDRTALSLRTIAWAALALMAAYPEAVVGASFQMSFAAVLALIALYEQAWLRASWRAPDGRWTVVRAAGVTLLALAATDLVAGGATNLFAIYHFHLLPTYSLASNLIAGPMTGLWIMPAALAGVVLIPLGLEAAPFKLMGLGVAALNGLAREVAAWPAAQIHVPPMSGLALAAGAGGIIFICLWKGRLRWLGIAPILAALAQPWTGRTPDILVDDSARVLAVSDAAGRLMFTPGRAGRFVRDVWSERYGASAQAWPGGDMACDANGCILERNGARVLLAFTAAALAEDCGAVTGIVSVLPARAFCRDGPAIDRFDLARDGAHAVWIGKDGWRVRSSRAAAGARVWTRGVPNNGAGDRRDGPAP